MIAIQKKAVQSPFDVDVLEQRLRRGEVIRIELLDGSLEITLEQAANGTATLVFAVTKSLAIVETNGQSEAINEGELKANHEELEEVSRITPEAREALQEGQQKRRRREAKKKKEARERLT